MHRFDRMRTGNSLGFVFECFDPPWWKFHRWIEWLFFSKGYAKGRVTMTVNGVSRSVRARAVQKDLVRPIVVREMPEDDA